MKNAQLTAAAATVMLHAVLFGAVLTSLTVDVKPDPPPIKVEVLAPPMTPTPAEPRVPQPAAIPAPPAKRLAPSTPAPRPAPQPQPAAPAPPNASETAPGPKSLAGTAPASSTAPATSNPAAAAPASPAAPAAPARTGASEASYAATNRKPPYPRLSRSNEEEGTVILRVLVTAEGMAGAVEIKSSSGYPPLGESARRTVQTWRFKPATVDGKPVQEWYQVPVPFKLEDN